jgi:hypothetical protein
LEKSPDARNVVAAETLTIPWDSRPDFLKLLARDRRADPRPESKSRRRRTLRDLRAPSGQRKRTCVRVRHSRNLGPHTGREARSLIVTDKIYRQSTEGVNDTSLVVAGRHAHPRPPRHPSAPAVKPVGPGFYLLELSTATGGESCSTMNRFAR